MEENLDGLDLFLNKNYIILRIIIIILLGSRYIYLHISNYLNNKNNSFFKINNYLYGALCYLTIIFLDVNNYLITYKNKEKNNNNHNRNKYTLICLILYIICFLFLLLTIKF